MQMAVLHVNAKRKPPMAGIGTGPENGPPIFQRVIEYVLRDVRDVADPYFDDILIGSPGATLEEAIANHDIALRRVLNALHEGSMVADQKKCKLFLKAVEFWTHPTGWCPEA